MHKFSTASTKSSVVLCALTALHSVGLLNVPYSTFAGASVARLVRSSLSSLRDKNLCIIRASKGHTLVETMIASSISIIVLAGFFSTIGVFQTGSSNLTLLLERDANLWLAPLLLSRWIIPAGNNRWDQTWTGVTIDTDRLELKSDIDGPGGFPDSDLSSSFEALALRSSNFNLRVRSNRGSFQPLIQNIVEFKVDSKENGLLSIRLKTVTDRPLSMTQEDLPESTELLFFLRNYRSNLFPENP